MKKQDDEVVKKLDEILRELRARPFVPYPPIYIQPSPCTRPHRDDQWFQPFQPYQPIIWGGVTTNKSVSTDGSWTVTI
jgi:hypothetical protein